LESIQLSILFLFFFCASACEMGGIVHYVCVTHFLNLFLAPFVCADFDTADIQCYEEVRRMAPFQRRVLVLVGAHGVGRRSLKEKLIKDDPRRFGSVIPREYKI
jgi:hypothetical protein